MRPTPEAVIRQGGTTVFRIGRNNFSPRYTNARTIQWVDSLLVRRGRHTFKAGVDTNFQRHRQLLPRQFQRQLHVQQLCRFCFAQAVLFHQAFAGPNTDGRSTKPNVNEYAFFAQEVPGASPSG